MPSNQMSEVIQHLRRTVLLRDGAGLTDGQLLEDYLSRRDEAALAALMWRHGPMVWGTCRRVLRNWHDAEDAFQATFLVFVRKAASIAAPELFANWLYGVARQTALKTRATTAKRSVRERQVTEMPESAVTEQDLWSDLQPLLDLELSRMPDKYRAAIVLCDLEGKTRKEAARQLGMPEGTLAARVARGRVMLAKRLARHRLAVSGASLATVLAQNAASASAPTSVVVSTIKAAGLFAAGQAAAAGVNSAKAVALAEGVLKTMVMTKLKIATAVLLVLGMLSFASGLLLDSRTAAQEPAERAGKRAPQADKDAVQGNKPTESKPVVAKEDAAHVRSLAWTSNGKILATVGIVYETVEFTDSDGKPTNSGGVIPHSTIKLWDATTGELKRSLGEEKDTYIAAIAFSADGKTAALSTSKHVLTKDPDNPLKFETAVRVLDAQTWALKHTVKTDGFASVLAFSPDGTSLALGGHRGYKAFVRLWDVQKQKMMGGTEDGGYRVHCLAFSSDGKQLATGDENGKVRLFDGRTGTVRRDFEGHGPLRSGGEQCVTGVGFSPDGKTLVSGSQDKTLKLWDVEKGELVRNLEGNKARVSALAFSPDGKLFATAGATADSDAQGTFEVLLWDMKTGQPKKTFPEQTLPFNSLAFSPDGSTLAIGAGAGFTSKVNTGTGRAKTPGGFKLWNLK